MNRIEEKLEGATVIGNIPEGAIEKLERVAGTSRDIRIVWADNHEVHVVLTEKRGENVELVGLRLFTIGESWEWSADEPGVLV